MELDIAITDGHGFSNEAHHKLSLKKSAVYSKAIQPAVYTTNKMEHFGVLCRL